MTYVVAALMIAFVVVVFGLFVFLEIFALKRLSGAWRKTALIPAVVIVVFITFIVMSIIYDPTSHNLWPFEIAAWCAGGCIFLGALFGLKALVER